MTDPGSGRAVGTGLSQPRPAEDIGSIVAERLAKGSRMKACLIVTPTGGGQGFQVVGNHGLSPEYVAQSCEEDDAITRAAFQGRPVGVPDLGYDAREGYRDLAQREGLASLVAVPMLIDQRVVGVARLYSNSPQRTVRRDLEALLAQAQLAALALENARLFCRSRLLFDVAQTVSSPTSRQDVGNLVAKAAARSVDARGAAVWIVEGSRQPELVGAWGLSQAYLQERVAHADCCLDEVMAGKTATVLDTQRDERIQRPGAAASEGIVSILSVPMVLSGAVVGAVCVHTASRHQFSPDEVECLQAMASVCAMALGVARN